MGISTSLKKKKFLLHLYPAMLINMVVKKKKKNLTSYLDIMRKVRSSQAKM